MPEGLRVSDQQREQAADALRDHFAAGRLTDDELNERLDAALEAKTEPELNALLADLPKLPVSPQQRKAELLARRSQLQRRVIQEAGGGAGLFVLCTGIWAASGAQGQFWPIWVLLVVLIPLLRNSWRLYGPSPELDRVERELERKARQDEERRGRRRGPRRL
ncbi:MAG TPA: DUF1707 domain-containing protein [Solirubrobacteraceae bacterium]|nr:DUF1707 domain-containing protein [Solirubrobacteraceae bacterium]